MTATAAESSLRHEHREHESGAGIAVAGAPELPIARERSTFTLVSVVLVAEIAWLVAIAYGVLLLAR